MRHQLSEEAFQACVDEALAGLPKEIQAAMHNVAVVFRSWPSRDDLQRTGTPAGQTLLGLYHGIPLTERTGAYNLVPPDTITLYQGPIEQSCRTPEEIPDLVRHVVIHEIAHHFGISDDRLRELGAY